jgi:hypothetical protein
VAVVVVAAGGDEGQPRVRRGDERRILLSRAVVRDLQHIRFQVGAGREDGALRFGLQVAGEQDPETVELDHHRDAGVVLRRAFIRGRRRRRTRRGQRRHLGRPQRRPAQLPNDALLAERCYADRDPVLRREIKHPVVLGPRREVRRHLDLVHPPIVEHAGQPADVIGMEMAQHDDRDVLDAKVLQAPIHRGRIRPGVDDNRRTVAGP